MLKKNPTKSQPEKVNCGSAEYMLYLLLLERTIGLRFGKFTPTCPYNTEMKKLLWVKRSTFAYSRDGQPDTWYPCRKID
jgi:hypothetical protein